MERSARRALLVAAVLYGAVPASPARSAAAGPPSEASPATSPAASGSDAREDSITVRYWVAGCSVAEDLWKYRKSSTITCDARGRTLASTQGVMAWPDYLMASDIDTLIVEGEGLAPLRFALEWSTDDTFAPERSVQQHDSSKDGEVRFVLDGEPGWRGLIRRFRLTWTGDPPPGSRIVAAWGRRQLSPGKRAG